MLHIVVIFTEQTESVIFFGRNVENVSDWLALRKWAGQTTATTNGVLISQPDTKK